MTQTLTGNAILTVTLIMTEDATRTVTLTEMVNAIITVQKIMMYVLKIVIPIMTVNVI